jgi:hypothetical protein
MSYPVRKEWDEAGLWKVYNDDTRVLVAGRPDMKWRHDTTAAPREAWTVEGLRLFASEPNTPGSLGYVLHELFEELDALRAQVKKKERRHADGKR